MSSASFRYGRVESRADLLPAEEQVVDVAVLDMNHGWPNLGHDSVVQAVEDAALALGEALLESGLEVRVLSYDVRRSGLLPEAPPGRFALYLGTGGPGHLDPHQNDGVSQGSQGIREDPSWEAPLFRLFDAILEDRDAVLLAVCHTFGVLCRWSGAARPVLRGPEKGGKSTGVIENALTPQAVDHPWFARFSHSLDDGRRFRVVDNRLYDLVPQGSGLPGGFLPLSHETLGVGGPDGDALTMLELARDRGGVLPRVLAVNHHPEIVGRARQLRLLRRKLESGEVGSDWYRERAEILARSYPDEDSDQRLRLTSDYTLLGPLRFHLERLVRQRAESLGRGTDLDENRLLAAGPALPAGLAG